MKKFIWLGLILFVAFVGCSLVDRDLSLAEEDFIDPGKGSLVLLLNGDALPTKTIEPITITMNVTHYELVFEGPLSADNFTQAIVAEASGTGLFVLNGLAVGDWLVHVNAYNGPPPSMSPGDGDLIGAINGNTTLTFGFTIIGGGTATFAVNNILPIIGTGTLDLDLDWPAAAVETPVIVASLVELTPTPAYTGIISTAFHGSINITGDPHTANHTEALNTGYYTLVMQLNDDTALAWGWIEAVRIIDGQTSYKSFTLSVAAGQLDLTASTNLHNPVQIDLGTLDPILSKGADSGLPLSQAVIPVLTPSVGTYTYQWYRDGIILGSETSVGITVSAASETLGFHNFTLVVTDTTNSTLSSENYKVEIVL